MTYLGNYTDAAFKLVLVMKIYEPIPLPVYPGGRVCHALCCVVSAEIYEIGK